MRDALILTGKELRSAFSTPVAYAIFAGFMTLAGFFFFGLLQQFNAIVQQAVLFPSMSASLNEWVVTPYYQTLEIVVLFLIPILTMRTFSEERRNGTFELLQTSPVSSQSLVWGKFLGVMLLIAVMLGLSFIYPLSLVVFADPETMPLLVGLLGLFLFTASLAAVGVAISTFTKSQTVAGVITLVVLLVLFALDSVSSKMPSPVKEIAAYLSPGKHSEALYKGVIESQDILYFISLLAVGLFLANRVLDGERWR